MSKASVAPSAVGTAIPLEHAAALAISTEQKAVA
jgi:hypothetical protein